MAPRKRSGSEAGVATRGATKSAKTDESKPNSKAAEKPASKPASSSAKAKSTPKKPASTAAKGGKRGPKAPAYSAFKSRALPLHVNITHTPPAIPDADTENAADADPGSLGAVTLLASEFATGSYGWKGAKRFTIELENPEDPSGAKEKVHVMLNINATVVGSKQAKDGKSDAKDDDDEEAAADEDEE